MSTNRFRASVLAVVVSIVGAPVVTAACEIWCGAAMTHQTDGCHDGDGAAPRVESRHGCTHVPDGVRAFVPTPYERLASLTAGPGTVMSLTTSLHVRDTWHSGRAHDRSPPGEAVASRLVLASVLRI